MGFNFFDRIYVINLESSKDRKNHIKKHFSDMGINNYEFFKAVDKDSKKIKVLNIDRQVSIEKL